MTQRLAALLLAACALGGCRVAEYLDCDEPGTVHGQYADVNIGALEFHHAVAWGAAERGHTVVFTNHRGYAEALQRSARPALDSELAAELLGLLVVGVNYGPDGELDGHFTLGTSVSSGYGSDHTGSIAVDAEGCARGHFALERGNSGVFALPRWRAETARLYGQGPEGGPATSLQGGIEGGSGGVDPLADWKRVHARLLHADSTQALRVLGLSTPVAQRLAAEPEVLATLQRLRTQCPDPLRARTNDDAEVEGPAEAAPGITLSGWVQTETDDGRLRLRLCSVSERNGEAIEQCFPHNQDCRQARVWNPSD